MHWVDERQTVEDLRRGVEGASDALYERYARRVYAYARRRLRNSQDAEDLTGYVFVKLLENPPDLKLPSLAPWLFRVAHNLVVNWHRNGARLQSTQLYEHAGVVDGPSAEKVERREALALVLEELPEKYQEVLILRVICELSVAETAAILRVSEGAVKARCHRARRLVAARMTQRLGELA